MPFNRSTPIPIVLLLLAACSAGAPTGSVPSSTGRSSTATQRAADLRGSVHLLTARDPQNLLVSKGRLPGSQVVRIQQGYGEVVLAKTNPNGTVSTRCVDSPEGADAFLSETASPTRAKAAQ